MRHDSAALFFVARYVMGAGHLRGCHRLLRWRKRPAACQEQHACALSGFDGARWAYSTERSNAMAMLCEETVAVVGLCGRLVCVSMIISCLCTRSPRGARFNTAFLDPPKMLPLDLLGFHLEITVDHCFVLCVHTPPSRALAVLQLLRHGRRPRRRFS